MSKQSKLVICVSVPVLFVIAFCYIFFDKGSDSIKTKVGVILPLSGNLAAIGEDMKKGFDLYKDQDFLMDFYYEDNKSTISDTVGSYQKLKNTVQPDVMIGVAIGGEALIPLSEKDGTPLVLTVSSASNLPAKGDYIFRYFINADNDAPVMAEYAATKKKFAILYLQDQFGIDYKDIFSNHVIKGGARVVASESFQYTDFDYRTQLLKLKRVEFDSLYLIGYEYQLITSIKQAKELGISAQIFSVGTIATKDSIAKIGSFSEGIYVTAFCTDGSPQSYVEEFQKKYGTYPSFFSEVGYDIAGILAKAVRSAGSSSESIKKGLLETKNFQGNAGVVSSDQYGEMIIPMCVKQIKDGKVFNLTTKEYSNY
jgi:branched-chain amino acid transport system substrate-binding protein